MPLNNKKCDIEFPHKNAIKYLLRLSLILAVAVTLLLPTKVLSATPPQYTYYVDPINGSNSNKGKSPNKAFKTIDKARDVVRTINTNMTGDIYIYLRGGTYWLTSTLTLTDTDSGTNGHTIIYSAYNGEKPVISGGRQITGWSIHDTTQNIYKAKVENIATRQLFINSVRATRARSTVKPSPLTFIKATGYTGNGNIFADNVKPIDQWKNLTDVEFVFKAEWTAPRVGVGSIANDGTTTTITMKQPAWGWATNKGLTSVGGSYNRNGLPWYIENAYELLDSEGEWYMDRITNTIYYKPRKNENISSAIVIAPVLNELIRIQGANLDHKAHNLQFKGITFSYTTDVEANSDKGHVDSQNNITTDTDGGKIISAAVNLKYANDIQFNRNIFEHLGNTGLNMYAGSQDNLVVGSKFTDISGNGIQVGDYKGWNTVGSENYGNNTDTRVMLRNNDVKNNYFSNIGVEYFSSTAIGATYPQDMDVLHNEIENVPYSGIHIGYGHNLTPKNVHKNTHIEFNYVHEVMKVLSDGGQIYVLGYTNGDASNVSTISNNYVVNLYNQTGALYTDNFSNWWNVTDNVVINAPRYFMSNDNANVTVTNTYTNVSAITMNRGGVIVSGTTLVKDNNWPTAAQTIMKNAGLEQPYQDIKPATLPAGTKNQ